MSTTIDQRVIAMKFDNNEFEKRTSTTLSTIDKLKAKLNFGGAQKELNNLTAAGKNFSLAGIGQGVEDIKNKFSTLSIVGITALTNIANKAVNVGLNLVKSFTIAPILDGFHQYEQQINATGTILANVSSSGATLKDVTKTLDVLNDYANKTIYSFSDMASNLGTFTSAGVKLGPAADAIQGLSNVAAAAGAGTQQAAGAMYQLSQALGRGSVHAADWNSVVAAGMASSNFKNALLETAKAMGTIKMPKTQSIEDWIKKGGNFQDAMQKGQITSNVLITALQAMAGKLTDAQFKQKGFTAEQIKSIRAMQLQAEAAAVNVKTFTQLKDNVSQGVGSAYAQVFKTLFGDINGATTLFTKLSIIANAIFVEPINHLNDFLVKLKGLGALKNFGTGITNIFSAMGIVFHNVAHAFREVFPPSSGKTILAISQSFASFTEHLKMGDGTAGDLMKTFRGLFSIIKIVVDVVTGAVGAFFKLFGVASALGGSGSGGILAITARIGSLITALQKWIDSTGGIEKFYGIIGGIKDAVIMPLVTAIGFVIKAISALVTGDISGFQNAMGKAFGSVGSIVDNVRDRIMSFVSTLQSGFSAAATWLLNFASAVKGQGSALGNVIGGWAQSVGAFLSHFSGTALGGVQNTVGKLTSSFDKLRGAMDFHANLSGLQGQTDKLEKMGKVAAALGAVWQGIVRAFDGVKNALAPITGALRDFFTTLTKKLTEYISGMDMQDAVAVLNTGFFIAMYMALRKFLSSMTGMIGELRGIFKDIGDAISGTFGQLTDTLKAMQQNVQATAILKIAGAVALLTVSVIALSRIDPKKLGIALGALTALFLQLGAAMKFMNFDQKGMLAATTGLNLMAFSILTLTGAVALLGRMNPKQLIQGLLAVGAILTGLTLFTKFAEVGNGGVKAGIGLMLLANAINILVIAVAALGHMSAGSVLQGISALAVVLVLLVGAVNSMEAALPGAAAIVLIAGSLAVLMPVIAALGLLPFDVILKGLGTIAIALLLLTTAANAMTAALPGAGAIAIMAASLLILTPVLITLGQLDVGTIVKSLITIALALTILVIAANAMEAALPGAAAMLVIAGALAVLTPVLLAFGQMSMAEIGKSLLMLAGVLLILVAAAYALTPVIVILSLFSTAILVLGAGLLLAGAGMFLFSAALAALAISGAAGFAVLMVGIQSFLAMLPLIAQQFGLAMVAFAKVIAVAAPKLIAAFTAIIVAFLNSMQVTVPKFIQTMGVILGALLTEIVRRAPQVYAAGLDLIIGLLKAIRSRIAEMTNLAIDIVVIFLTTLKNRLPSIIQAGIELIVSFMNGLAAGIRSHKDEIAQAGYNIGSAIVEGIVHGVGIGKDKVIQAAKDLADHLPSWVKKVLGIASPSKVFEQIGIYVNEGLIKGLTGNSDQVQAAFDHLKDIVRSAKDSAAKDITDYNAKIKKLNAELVDDDKAIAKQRQVLRDAENKQMTASTNGKAATAAQEAAFHEAKMKAIQAAKDKLESLTAARSKDVAAIAAAKVALAGATDEYSRSSDAYFNLTNNMGENVRQLQTLAGQIDDVKDKIKTANDQLDAAVKTRDDYKKSIADSFDALPDINKDTTLADYVAGLQAKQANVTEFSAALQSLRDYGLSDEMYQEFLKKGVDSLPFIEEVLKGGQASVLLLNDSANNLSVAADALGAMASNSMYQAGVNTAQGLLDGLVSQEAALEAEMARIAAIVAQTTKDKLKIKSPSRVFMKIGVFTAQGLAKGIRNSSPMLERTAGDVGDNVVNALKETISGMSDLVPMNMDLQPTITPILDLSNVQKDALKLNSMLPSQSIDVQSAYARARAANAGYNANAEAAVTPVDSVDRPMGDVVFNQTINSPKAVSSADVYRNTRNQISQAKEALTGVTPS